MTPGRWFLYQFLAYAFLGLSLALLAAGYADVLAGLLAAAMLVAGVWLSAKGMARLKHADIRSDDSLDELEIAYRYRNAGIALGLTGSGLLVFSWQTFLARFISAAAANSGM